MDKWPATLDIDGLVSAGWSPTPFTEFVLKIHSRCDLSCAYCYMYTMADKSWRTRPQHMSLETIDMTAFRINEHVRKHSLGAVEVVFHGGEPLLAGERLIEYAVTRIRASADTQVDFGIQTNAVLLDADYLKLFDSLSVQVAVSLDGNADAHDRYRRRANGQGSHAAVVRSLELLLTDPFRHLFSGLLCTINPHNDPIETYEALLQFQPPAIDFLLPHGNWESPPPGRIPAMPDTPYANWLIRVFDHWYAAPRQQTHVRLFAEIMKLLIGRRSSTELVGLSPIGTVVVETDGSLEQSDILKSAFPGAPSTGLHIARDPFDSVLYLPGMAARQIGLQALCGTCLSCEIHRICGGGLYAHRYSPENGFANPSVYCPDLMALISHIRAVMRADLAELRRRRS
jgi:uncharacterized protein